MCHFFDIIILGDSVVYLLYGDNEYLIDDYVEKISKGIDKMNINVYDLDNDSMSLVIDDCETYSMFQDKKMVIADNANMFTGFSNKDSELIQNYLSNINPSTILIFIVHSNKIDNRKKITTLVKSKGKVEEFNNDVNAEAFVKGLLEGYNISYGDTKLLIDRVGDNPLILKNEVEKLILYKSDDKEITSSDIINLTVRNINNDIFKFIDNIVMRRREEAIQNYHDMILMGEEPIMIIVMLADQFRIMYQTKELLMKGYSEKGIVDVIKVHPYRVKLAIQKGRSYASSTLLKYINDLADLDVGIKSGDLDKNLALELFLLNL